MLNRLQRGSAVYLSQLLRLVAFVWAVTLLLSVVLTVLVLLLMHGQEELLELPEVYSVLNWSTCAGGVGLPVLLFIVAAWLDWMWDE